ncbi:MAG: 3-ketoacyl-ACP reductase [bacterium]
MSKDTPVILITGASRGLGRGIALKAAEQGFSVVINYAGNADAAEETAKLCKENRASRFQQFIPIQADIAQKENRDQLIKMTIEQMGRIDAFVSNAGIAPRVRADLLEMTEESFEEVLSVNLQGAFFLAQRIARYWLSHKMKPLLPGGYKMIFNSSVSAGTLSVNRGEYCISKAGLAMASQLFAARLAVYGIQVYELRPGIMASDMTSGVKEKYDKLIAEGLVPMRRWGTPEDVGAAVGSILAGHFPFSTGEVIYLDGGLHLHIW